MRVLKPEGSIINQNLDTPVKINVPELGDFALLLKAEVIRINEQKIKVGEFSTTTAVFTYD